MVMTIQDTLPKTPPVEHTFLESADKRVRETGDQFPIGTLLHDIYEIRSILGQGGMGQVFAAYDHLLARTVAIKVSWPHIPPGALIEEARAMAALGGRGVPAVYFMNTHEGIEYCVMERLHGRTLAKYMFQHLRHRQMDCGEVIDILVGVAEALLQLHSVGLVHRDLKPTNIMLTPGNRTVLFDLGLFLTRGDIGDEHQTKPCGSPRYMAPEIITASMIPGQEHLLDIYALGIIAYILLSRRHPFRDAATTMVLWQHVYEDPQKLSTIRDDISPRLERLVHEMLAKEPTERPFSIDAVVAELHSIRAEL